MFAAVCGVTVVGLAAGVGRFIDWLEYREVQRQAHEQWLRTPEGIASQAAEREKQRLEKEAKERPRREAEAAEREKRRLQLEVAERLAREAAERARNAEAEDARSKWIKYHESKSMAQLAKMSGTQFEEFLARLFARMEYAAITLTATNDQGGDILCVSPQGVPLVIQAKRWKSSVGNGAVQELLGAMLFYGRAVGLVVTNSQFTAAAKELAAKHPCISLFDGAWLAERVNLYFPPTIPEFNWEDYNRFVKNFAPERRKGTRKLKSCRSRRWRR